MPSFFVSIIAQSDNLSRQIEACGAVDQSNDVCLTIFRLTNNVLISKILDVALLPARLFLIVFVGLVLTMILRHALKKMVRGVQGGTLSKGKWFLRKRTPLVLVDSDDTEAANVRQAQRADSIAGLLYSVGYALIWGIALLMMLGEFGLNLGPIIAGAGLLGVALGLGAQTFVRDFLSGIFILLEDQYGLGDVIDAGPATGHVEAISLRITRVRDIEGVVWHIPNGEIKRVGNKSQRWSRVVLDIQVAYKTDINHATEVMKRVALQMAGEEQYSEIILEQPEVWGVENLGADGIVLRLVVKTQPLKQWDVTRELRTRIKNAFDSEKIEVA